MKTALKTIIAVILSAGILLSVSGCKPISTDTDSLMTPPAYAKDLKDIQKVLYGSVGDKFTLKFPTGGDYRSAIVQEDINGDGVTEAFAFYSTTVDNTVTMHINMIVKSDGQWVTAGDVKCVASGVESVEFVDMNGDGVKEVLVGWSVYGSLEKSIGVYSVSDNRLSQSLLEQYTKYICRDFDGDGVSELLVIYLDSAAGKSTAKLIKITQNGVDELGKAEMDGTVNSYSTPLIADLDSGIKYIYLDAVKGNGMVTEVLVTDGKSLTNPMYDEVAGMTAQTYRSSGVAIRDIDGDGLYEIPIPQILTKTNDSDSDNIYKTQWYGFNGTGLELKLSALMNYTDGYFIVIPQKWEDKISVVRSTAERTRIIRRYDEETGVSAEELVRILVVPTTAENVDVTGYTEITRTKDYIYYSKISGYVGEQAITEEELSGLFNILSQS